MSVVIPYVFVGGVGNKARASEVNANFAAIAAKFTEGSGGISDGDISATAGIKASKLSSIAGNRITQAQLEDDAVDLRVLKDDATAGAPNAAVNTSAHIKDGIVTGAKIAAATIAKDRLKLSSVVVAIPAVGATTVTNFDTTLIASTAFPIMMHIEAAADPAMDPPDMDFALNTVSGHWLIHTVNDTSFTTGALSLRVYYLSIT